MMLLLGVTICANAQGAALNITKTTINIGDVADLDVTGTDKIPVWTSYNANIAKVNAEGEVTAVRKGKTTIKARAGSEYLTCAVTVVDSSIKLNKTAAAIYTGGTSANTVQLKATVKGATKDIVWTSSDESVAVVDAKGKVTSVSAGTAVITATANRKSADCTVTVQESSIALNMASMQLSTKGTGSSVKLTPAIVGSKKSVTWSTSDKTIATVSGGKVTGKKTGTAVITATANGVSATCDVTVVNGLISISDEKVLLYAGGTKTETKQLKTNAGKNDVVTWSTSDDEVASVNEKGLVTAVGEGIAVISVECNGTRDTCEVTVKQTETDILEDSVSLKTKGTEKTYTLGKEITGKSTSVKWKTSDSKVVSVSNGKLTAKKAGTAVITATANGVSDTVKVTVYDYDPTIKLNQSEYVLYTVKGNTVTLKATVDGASKAVTWTSSNEQVATVSNKGKVTAAGAGETIISATANGVTAQCIITVNETAVHLAKTSITLSAGKSEIIPVDVVGTSQTVKWASTNSKVVTVKNGSITAKKNGEADIKVTANGVTAVCHVIVGDCEHSYEGYVTKEPSCSEVGEKTYICSKCGDTYTEAIATIPHNYEETVTAPTCTEQGYTTHTCVNCGDNYADTYTEATGHDWGEWVIEKNATDIENGIRARYCKVCNARETEAIPKGHTHVYNTSYVEPTCTEEGYTLYVCECGDSYKTDIIPAMGHNMRDWVVEKAATTEEEGIEKRECSRCDYEETRTIPKHVHNFVLTQKQDSTCVTAGYLIYTCECGEIKEEEIPASGHSYVDTVVEPTCTEQGYTEHKCSVCGDVYTDSYTDELGHEEIEVTDIEPTCTEYGWSHIECSKCHEQLTVSGQDMNLAPTGHLLDEGVTTEATCTEQGYTTYTCTRDGCDYSVKDDYTDALGHEKGSIAEVVDASKEGQGYTLYECSRCDAEIKDDYTDYNPTEEQVYNDIIALKEKYPEGMTWTSENYYHSNGESMWGGYGCEAFALILTDEAFGYLPAREHTDLSNIKVGDHLSLYNEGHAAVVLEVTDDGGVYTAEGNVGGTITWKSGYSYLDIAEYVDYVITRYPE